MQVKKQDRLNKFKETRIKDRESEMVRKMITLFSFFACRIFIITITFLFVLKHITTVLGDYRGGG